jgi:site-specific DNA-methyltransferase (adenine-specific)
MYGETPGHRRTEMLGFVSPNWSEKATHSRGYADHDSEVFAALLDVVWDGVRQSLPPGGMLAAFCGNRTFHEMVTAATLRGFSVLDILTFVTETGVAKSTTTLRPGHELAALMRLPGPVRHINPTWRESNVYALNKSRKAESDHLTTKPLSWMHALTLLLTKESETILDPFAGSGSTLRAAKDLGRRAIGVELEERYCEIAARRLAQDTLFGGVA